MASVESCVTKKLPHFLRSQSDTVASASNYRTYRTESQWLLGTESVSRIHCLFLFWFLFNSASQLIWISMWTQFRMVCALCTVCPVIRLSIELFARFFFLPFDSIFDFALSNIDKQTPVMVTHNCIAFCVCTLIRNERTHIQYTNYGQPCFFYRIIIALI